MKKFLVFILIYPLYLTLTAYDEKDYSYYSFWRSIEGQPDWKCFQIGTTEGSAQYIISSDGSIVSLYMGDCSARSGFYAQKPPMDYVKDPDGIVHAVNAIGNPWREEQPMCVAITLPFNVRYVYDNSHVRKCGVPISRGVSIEDNHEFDYFGTNSCVMAKDKTIRIADNGTVCGPQELYRFKTLQMGVDVSMLSRGNYFFHVEDKYKIPFNSSGNTYYDYIDEYRPHNIVCRDLTPPVVQGSDGEPVEIFNDEMGYRSDYSRLYVPRESLDAYRADPRWGKFADIRAIEDGIDYSAIELVEYDSNVPTEWYTLQGIKLKDRPTRSGIYVERCGKKSRKVMIE